MYARKLSKSQSRVSSSSRRQLASEDELLAKNAVNSHPAGRGAVTQRADNSFKREQESGLQKKLPFQGIVNSSLSLVNKKNEETTSLPEDLVCVDEENKIYESKNGKYQYHAISDPVIGQSKMENTNKYHGYPAAEIVKIDSIKYIKTHRLNGRKLSSFSTSDIPVNALEHCIDDMENKGIFMSNMTLDDFVCLSDEKTIHPSNFEATPVLYGYKLNTGEYTKNKNNFLNNIKSIQEESFSFDCDKEFNLRSSSDSFWNNHLKKNNITQWHIEHINKKNEETINGCEISAEDMEMLEFYTHDSDFCVNNYLRGIERGRRINEATTLIKVFDHLPSSNHLLFRGGQSSRNTSGIHFRENKLKNGDYLINTDFSSFTASPGIARWFFSQNNNTAECSSDETSVVFVLKNAKNAKPISAFSVSTPEAESTYRPGYIFKINNIEFLSINTGKLVQVEIEEVGSYIESLNNENVTLKDLFDFRTGKPFHIKEYVEMLDDKTHELAKKIFGEDIIKQAFNQV